MSASYTVLMSRSNNSAHEDAYEEHEAPAKRRFPWLALIAVVTTAYVLFVAASAALEPNSHR